MAVIGHEVVEAAAAQPAGIAQRQARGGRRSRPASRLERLVDICASSSPLRRSTTSCRRTPQPDHRASAIAPAMRPRRRGAAGRFARRQSGLPGGGGDDGDEAGAEKQHEAGDSSSASGAAPSRASTSEAWAPARPAALAAIARDGDAYLPVAAVIIHSMPGKNRGRLTIATRRRAPAQTVRRAGERQRHDADLSCTSSLVVSTSTSATPGTACGGRIVDEDAVRPGLAIEKYVRAADVASRSGDAAARTSARCPHRSPVFTRCIQCRRASRSRGREASRVTSARQAADQRPRRLSHAAGTGNACKVDVGDGGSAEVHVGGAEEPVAGERRHQEIGERPLHRDERGEKGEPRRRAPGPAAAARGALQIRSMHERRDDQAAAEIPTG